MAYGYATGSTAPQLTTQTNEEGGTKGGNHRKVYVTHFAVPPSRRSSAWDTPVGCPSDREGSPR